MANANDYKYEHFNVTFPAEYVAHVEINRPDKLNAFFEQYVLAGYPSRAIWVFFTCRVLMSCLPGIIIGFAEKSMSLKGLWRDPCTGRYIKPDGVPKP
jgi:hypothetical protein